MPIELKIVVAINIIATILLSLAMVGFGSGIANGVFPLAKSIELTLIPIEPARREKHAAPETTERMEIPTDFRTLDLSPPLWKLMPDGTVQFEPVVSR